MHRIIPAALPKGTGSSNTQGAPRQYDSRKSNTKDTQDLNTRLFYDIIRQNRISETSIFVELVSKYDLVVHSISSLSLQGVDVTKEPIICTLTTLQNMTQSLRADFGESM